jgi:hypothetical protein
MFFCILQEWAAAADGIDPPAQRPEKGDSE